jgi:hypothetical protein
MKYAVAILIACSLGLIASTVLRRCIAQDHRVAVPTYQIRDAGREAGQQYAIEGESAEALR